MEAIAETGKLLAEKAELEGRTEKAQEANAVLEGVSTIYTTHLQFIAIQENFSKILFILMYLYPNIYYFRDSWNQPL
jgi:hypothetical protein